MDDKSGLTPAAKIEKEQKRDADLIAMVKRANKGDKSALASVREMLNRPRGADLFGGNLAYQAELSLIENVGGDQLVFKEALGRKLAVLRDELAGPNPTPLERLLVERVVACWLQVQDADVRYAQGQKTCTFAQSEYYQRRQDRAHNRYLSAMRTLAVVRKLTIPVVQVNIARKQVNVGQAQVNATAAGNGALEGARQLPTNGQPLSTTPSPRVP